MITIEMSQFQTQSRTHMFQFRTQFRRVLTDRIRERGNNYRPLSTAGRICNIFPRAFSLVAEARDILLYVHILERTDTQ